MIFVDKIFMCMGYIEITSILASRSLLRFELESTTTQIAQFLIHSTHQEHEVVYERECCLLHCQTSLQFH